MGAQASAVKMADIDASSSRGGARQPANLHSSGSEDGPKEANEPRTTAIRQATTKYRAPKPVQNRKRQDVRYNLFKEL